MLTNYNNYINDNIILKKVEVQIYCEKKNYYII